MFIVFGAGRAFGPGAAKDARGRDVDERQEKLMKKLISARNRNDLASASWESALFIYLRSTFKSTSKKSCSCFSIYK